MSLPSDTKIRRVIVESPYLMPLPPAHPHPISDMLDSRIGILCHVDTQ
jgi:hypothetical protein